MTIAYAASAHPRTLQLRAHVGGPLSLDARTVHRLPLSHAILPVKPPPPTASGDAPPAGPLTSLQIVWNGVRAVRWYVWLAAAGAGGAVLATGTALACRHGCACCAAAAPRVTNITNITNYYGRARPHESRVGWGLLP